MGWDSDFGRTATLASIIVTLKDEIDNHTAVTVQIIFVSENLVAHLLGKKPEHTSVYIARKIQLAASLSSSKFIRPPQFLLGTFFLLIITRILPYLLPPRPSPPSREREREREKTIKASNLKNYPRNPTSSSLPLIY